MSKGAKTAVLAVVIIGLVAGAFWGGTFYAGKTGASGAAGGRAAGGPGGAGGPMSQLTAAEQAKVQNMTDAEKQAFFQEKMGSPAGGAGARGGGAPSLEGSVVEVSGKTVTLKLTSGGSSTVYLTDDTVMAFAEGVAAKDLATGDDVIVMATPAADNVMNATAIIVK